MLSVQKLRKGRSSKRTSNICSGRSRSQSLWSIPAITLNISSLLWGNTHLKSSDLDGWSIIISMSCGITINSWFSIHKNTKSNVHRLRQSWPLLHPPAPPLALHQSHLPHLPDGILFHLMREHFPRVACITLLRITCLHKPDAKRRTVGTLFTRRFRQRWRRSRYHCAYIRTPSDTSEAKSHRLKVPEWR